MLNNFLSFALLEMNGLFFRFDLAIAIQVYVEVRLILEFGIISRCAIIQY
jgi:hypothetical protein